MPINITMPALSPTMEEGNLAKWLVKEGDKVTSGDVIAEIETDKATMEVEAVDEGTVAKLVVPAGTEGVKVNAVIAILAAEGEDAAAAAKGGGAAPAKAEAPKADAPKAEAAEGRGAKAEAAEAAAARRRKAAAAPAANGAAASGERTFASPLARRIAKDAGRRRCRRSRAPARMAASSRPMSRRRSPAAAPRPRPPRQPAPAGAAAALRAEGDVRRAGAEAVRGGLLRARAA